MGRFYRHVLIEGNYPHHGAVAYGHHGKALYEVFKYIGVCPDEIGYNHPRSMYRIVRRIYLHKNQEMGLLCTELYTCSFLTKIT